MFKTSRYSLIELSAILQNYFAWFEEDKKKEAQTLVGASWYFLLHD